MRQYDKVESRYYLKYSVMNNQWHKLPSIKSLKRGDIFMAFEARDVDIPVKSVVPARITDGNGHNVWIASSDPYYNKEIGEFTIDTLY